MVDVSENHFSLPFCLNLDELFFGGSRSTIHFFPQNSSLAMLLANDFEIENRPQRIGYYETKKKCITNCMRGLVTCFNVLFLLGAICSLIFILFFDGFLLTLWPACFCVTLALVVSLVCCSVLGFFFIVTKHIFSLSVYTVTTVVTIALAVTTCYFFVSATDESDLHSIGEEWKKAINGRGDAEQRVCEVEKKFECSGWNEVCPPISVTETLSILDAVRLHSGNLLVGNNTSDCPRCINSVPFYNTTCIRAIHASIQRATPWIIAFSAVGVLMFILCLFWGWRAHVLTKNISEETMLLNQKGSRYL